MVICVHPKYTLAPRALPGLPSGRLPFWVFVQLVFNVYDGGGCRIIRENREIGEIDVCFVHAEIMWVARAVVEGSSFACRSVACGTALQRRFFVPCVGWVGMWFMGEFLEVVIS